MQGMIWQPGSTAPKDGTMFIAHNDCWECAHTVRWGGKVWLFVDELMNEADLEGFDVVDRWVPYPITVTDSVRNPQG